MTLPATLLLTAFSLTASPSTSAAPSADLIGDVKSRWNQLKSTTLDEDGYRDKKRFASDLADYADEGLDEPRAAKKTAAKLVRLVSKKSEPGLAWRIHELRGRLLQGAAEFEDAVEAYEAAVASYPAETYAAPSKQSYFHHLVVSATVAHAEARDLDGAERFLLDIIESDARMQHLHVHGLEMGYLDLGHADRLASLYGRLATLVEKRWPEVARDLKARDLPDLRSVDGDPMKKFLVLGAGRAEATGSHSKTRPLVLILPGGSGQALDFRDWLTRITEPLVDDYVFAVLSAPQWSREQAEEWVWVTGDVQKKYRASFPVEEFAQEVVSTLRGDASLRLGDAYVFAWSSGGPATYCTVLEANDVFRGAYVLASVFKPERLDLKRARGLRFWLEQGTSDRVTPIRFARKAAETLEKNQADVSLVEFDGGHGFAMPDAARSLGKALEWLTR